MIVDTSAVVAVINREDDWARYATALREAGASLMSAATCVELGIVVDRLGDPSVSRRLDRRLAAWNVDAVPLTPAQARLARAAHVDFGRGRGPAAALNLGDCYAYASATERDEPLLFTGDDFTHTDVRSALA